MFKLKYTSEHFVLNDIAVFRYSDPEKPKKSVSMLMFQRRKRTEMKERKQQKKRSKQDWEKSNKEKEKSL